MRHKVIAHRFKGLDLKIFSDDRDPLGREQCRFDQTLGGDLLSGKSRTKRIHGIFFRRNTYGKEIGKRAFAVTCFAPTVICGSVKSIITHCRQYLREILRTVNTRDAVNTLGIGCRTIATAELGRKNNGNNSFVNMSNVLDELHILCIRFIVFSTELFHFTCIADALIGIMSRDLLTLFVIGRCNCGYGLHRFTEIIGIKQEFK